MEIPAARKCLQCLPSLQRQTSVYPGVLLGLSGMSLHLWHDLRHCFSPCLETSCSWHETRGRLGCHFICLCSDLISNFKFLWDSEVREGNFHLSCWVWEALHMPVWLLFYLPAVLWHMWVQCSENYSKKHLTGQLICSCSVWLLPLESTIETR